MNLKVNYGKDFVADASALDAIQNPKEFPTIVDVTEMGVKALVKVCVWEKAIIIQLLARSWLLILWQ